MCEQRAANTNVRRHRATEQPVIRTAPNTLVRGMR